MSGSIEVNVFDLSSIAEELRGDIQSVILAEVIEVCRLSLERAVRNTVYATGSAGTMYERTREFLNAVEVMNIEVGGTIATFNVTINPAKMNLYPATRDEWGKHEGLKGQDFREGLIEILDQGGGSRLYAHNAHNFFDKSHDDLDRHLLGVMQQAMRARGWTIT